MKQSSLHVAIIMDGNGRWARSYGLPRFAGHQAGAESLRSIIEAAPENGISLLSLYAFSSDNWKRPREEVDGLMDLIAHHLKSETPRLLANDVRMTVMGRRDRLPASLLETIGETEWTTRHASRLHIQLAIDYSSRDAIARAAELTSFRPSTLEGLAGNLGRPVDLLIRTGGEQRLSDFMLWECAYAELLFTQRMWPDFSKADLESAIAEYRKRNRRFGALSESPSDSESAGHAENLRWLR